MENAILWFQAKIGNYDRQSWEYSIEQRILHGLESRPKKESTLNTDLLDLDLVRGSAFSKAKPKHDWIAVLRRGFLHTAFAASYWDYWQRHTSPRIASYLMVHFCLQLLQALCFLTSQPQDANMTSGDVFVPVVLALCLGILHSHFTSSHGALPSLGSDTAPNSESVVFGVPASMESAGSHQSASIPSVTDPVACNTQDRDSSRSEELNALKLGDESCSSDFEAGVELGPQQTVTSTKATSYSGQRASTGYMDTYDERAFEADDDSDNDCPEESDIFVGKLLNRARAQDCVEQARIQRVEAIKSSRPPIEAGAQTGLEQDANLEETDAEEGQCWPPQQCSASPTRSTGRLMVNRQPIADFSASNVCRRRSNSLGSGFYACQRCRHIPAIVVHTPSNDVLSRFKAAKLRGVPDPEVFADSSLRSSSKAHTSDSKPDTKARPVSKALSSEQSNSFHTTQPNGCSSISEMTSGHANASVEFLPASSVAPSSLQACNQDNRPEGTLNESFEVLPYMQVCSSHDSTPPLREPSQITCAQDNRNLSNNITPSDEILETSISPQPLSLDTLAIASLLDSEKATVSTISDGEFECKIPTTSESDNRFELSSCQSLSEPQPEHLNGDAEVWAENGVLGENVYADCGLNDDSDAMDTFTCHQRQKIKFMRLFMERTNKLTNSRIHGMTTNPVSSSGLPKCLVRTGLISESYVCSSELSEASAPPSTESATLISHKSTKLNCLTITASDPSCLLTEQTSRIDGEHHRGTQTVVTRKPGPTYRSHINPMKLQRRAPPTSQRSAAFGTSILRDSKSLAPNPRSTKGQTASETEYDRINSDVGSDVDSSSPSEGISHSGAPLLARGPVEKDSHSTDKVGLGVRFAQENNLLLVSTGLHNHSNKTRSIMKPNPFSVADFASAGLPANTSVVSKLDTFVPEYMCSGAAQSASYSNTDSVCANTLACGEENATKKEDPFMLWYMRTFQSSTACSAMGALETVGCYIWEADKLKKVNLTLLDIGWNIIQAVERQAVSVFYPKLACWLVMFLALLPLLFHSHLLLLRRGVRNITVGLSLGGSQQGSSFLDSPAALCTAIGNFLGNAFSGWPQPIITCLAQGDWQSLAGIAKKWLTQHHPHLVVVAIGVWLRLNLYGAIFFLLCVAERTFQQRLLYAKHFFSLTSSRRARKSRIPHFRLNKVVHVKCWLTLRSYLKRRGPQRSVEGIITGAFYLAFILGLILCAQMLTEKPREGNAVSSLVGWDMLALSLAVSIFLLRFLTLGTKITKKYRNLSVMITEQINAYLSMEKKPHKKEELSITNQVLRLAECLIKEVDGPFRVCGWTVNPLVYNLFKLVLLSCFSALLSDTLGFKLKLYKLKLNPANW